MWMVGKVAPSALFSDHVLPAFATRSDLTSATPPSAGKTKVEVQGGSFSDGRVDYVPDETCLELVMLDSLGDGWRGAEVRIYHEEDYQGEQVYRCPQTCQGGYSCDHWSLDWALENDSGDGFDFEGVGQILISQTLRVNYFETRNLRRCLSPPAVTHRPRIPQSPFSNAR